MRKSTDLWIKDEVRARLFGGTPSRRARPTAGAVGGDQLLRISSPYVHDSNRIFGSHQGLPFLKGAFTPYRVSVRRDSLAERGEFELTGDFISGQ